MAGVFPVYHLVTDEDCLAYLKYRNPANVLPGMNPFIYHPNNLPEGMLFLVQSYAPKFYEGGYWEQKGPCRKIQADGGTIGWVKYLDFYEGEAPNGKETIWVMQAYTLDPEQQDSNMLCRVQNLQELIDVEIFLMNLPVEAGNNQIPHHSANRSRINGRNEHGPPAALENDSETYSGPAMDAIAAQEEVFLEMNDLTGDDSSSSENLHEVDDLEEILLQIPVEERNDENPHHSATRDTNLFRGVKNLHDTKELEQTLMQIVNDQIAHHSPNGSRVVSRNEHGPIAALDNYSETNPGPGRTRHAISALGEGFLEMNDLRCDDSPSPSDYFDAESLLRELGEGKNGGSDQPNVRRCRVRATPEPCQVVLKPSTSGFLAAEKSNLADKNFTISPPENQKVTRSSLHASPSAKKTSCSGKAMEHAPVPEPELGTSTSHGGDKKRTSKLAKTTKKFCCLFPI